MENRSFLAPVDYLQPDYDELVKRFPVHVCEGYQTNRRFEDVCLKEAPRENRVVRFEYVCMDRNPEPDVALAEMKKQGLRPARYEELLGFAKLFLEESQNHLIMAIGSEMTNPPDRTGPDPDLYAPMIDPTYYAYLLNGGLYLQWIDYGHPDNLDQDRIWFLAVRE